MRSLRGVSPYLHQVTFLVFVVLLAFPSVMLAGHDLTCHPPTGPESGSHEIEMAVHVGKNPGGPDGFTMSTMTIHFTGDGSVMPRVTGTFVLRNEKAERAVTWTSIALAESGGKAEARCADGADDDSLVGLESLIIPFRHNQTGDTSLVSFLPDSEIDASGRYGLVVRGMGEEPLQFDVDVRMRGSFGEASR